MTFKCAFATQIKGGKCRFYSTVTACEMCIKGFFRHAFACCQKEVKGVSRFVCDSSQRFAKNVVEDTCEAGQRFVKGAFRVSRSHVSPELLARAPHSRLATSHRVPHLLRFCCLLHGFLALYTKDATISVLLLYA